MRVTVFVDFDGTVTSEDVGNVVFAALGGDACAIDIGRYHRGEISARECFRREATLAGVFEQGTLDGVIDNTHIDPTFADFVSFCSEREFPLTILSDGLNYYIERILRTHNLSHVSWVSNLAALAPGDAPGTRRLDVSFPFSNPDCDRCACCKRNIMLSASGEDDYIVYVGEGFSDFCPAAHADLVFAKSALQTHCQRENISYLPYSTFADVRQLMETRVLTHTLRRKHRAELARRAAFAAE